ncbi:unnamed protein product, partial [Symbiodinium sp. CCMP2592]
MKLPAVCSLVGAFVMPWVARSCSVSGDWQETSPAEQWGAASYVISGVSDGLSGCGILSADQQYRPEDAALFNASGPCVPTEAGYLVLVRNLTFTKGSISNCSEIVVGGFSGRSACGVDPPSVNSTGTFFLCNVVVEGGVCRGMLNQEGNIHLGFVSEAVPVPASTLCPQDGTCYDVTRCSAGSLSNSHWITMIPSLLGVLLMHDQLPEAKTWRELRRDPRFDHSPGSKWRTQLLPQEESQDPKRIQISLVKSQSIQRLLYLLDAGDMERWTPVNLATAWHRLAKFSRNEARKEQPEEREMHAWPKLYKKWKGKPPMSFEGWRLSRTELRDVFNKYEQAIEKDAYNLLQPSKLERKLLGEDIIDRRVKLIRKARDVNRDFVDEVIEDLPDIMAGPDAGIPPARPVAEVRKLPDGVDTLPGTAYGMGLGLR